MTEPAAEVGIKLVADDQSAATLEKVRGNLHLAGDEARITQGLLQNIDANLGALVQHAKDAKGGTEGMAEEVAKGNLEFELMRKSVELVAEGIKIAWEFSEKLTDAALESAEAAEKQEKEMAGFLYLMDQGKHSMAELRDYTSSQREEFEEFGVTAGIAVKDLVASYDKLIQRGTMSSEKAKELTEQMAVVGRVVPGGMEALAQGMNGVEMGMVRARNPIVQLIAATHTLKGNAQGVAQQMKHMSPEEQMKLAEQAISKQAETLKKMGAITPDLEHLKQSFEGVKEGFLESMGQPMTEALVPNLVKLRDFLAKHMEQIKAFGEKVGAAAANAIEFVSTALEGIYSGLTYNWDVFKQTFHEIFGDWEAAWDASKSTTQEIKQEFFAVGTFLQSIFVGIAKIIHAVVDEMMDVNDQLHLRAGGTTRAAIQGDVMTRGAMDPTLPAKKFEEAVENFRKTSQYAGKSDKDIDAAISQARQMQRGAASAASDDKAAVVSQDWGKVNEALEYNIQHHQQGLLEYQAGLIIGSKEAQEALVQGKIHIASGMDELMKMISDKSPEVAAKLRDLGNVVKNQGGIKPSGPVQNFYGGVHVKQDFKDQDPDRVLITFKRGLAGAAANRTTSRLSSPFGW